MSNNNTYKYPKNKRIQIYFAKDVTPTGDKGAKQYVKHYIYDQATYDAGGLWAYVRDTSTVEYYEALAVNQILSSIFIVNYNPKISTYAANGLNIEYYPAGAVNNQVYTIKGQPDRFEYGINDFKLKTEKVAETRTFTGVEFET